MDGFLLLFFFPCKEQQLNHRLEVAVIFYYNLIFVFQIIIFSFFIVLMLKINFKKIKFIIFNIFSSKKIFQNRFLLHF